MRKQLYFNISSCFSFKFLCLFYKSFIQILRRLKPSESFKLTIPVKHIKMLFTLVARISLVVHLLICFGSLLCHIGKIIRLQLFLKINRYKTIRATWSHLFQILTIYQVYVLLVKLIFTHKTFFTHNMPCKPCHRLRSHLLIVSRG